MHILLTGATGLVGSSLIQRLILSGHTLTILSRSAERARASLGFPLRAFDWNPERDPAPEQAFLDGPVVDAVVHLAGESVASGRWTTERKRSILESRQLGTRNLVATLLKLAPERRPKVLVSASAVGIYGRDAQGEMMEESRAAEDFLAQVCSVWESEARQAESAGIRTVQGRIGIVLSPEGGALAQMLQIFAAGAGGPQGSGRQWMSWIHIDDLVSAIVHAVETQSLRGPVNWVAPHPVTNKQFAQSLGRVLARPAILPAPALALRAAFGEMADVILGGQQVSAAKLVASGFRFKHERLEDALGELLADRRAGDYVFRMWQWVPAPIDQVFPFFSSEKNLEAITPEILSFSVLGKSTPEITQGTIIDYRLKIHGVPARWKTEISEWNPPKEFTDSQLKGPYRKWVHHHRFFSVQGGTLMEDEVHYQLPLGKLGDLAAGWLVHSDVKKIFTHRREVIAAKFG